MPFPIPAPCRSRWLALTAFSAAVLPLAQAAGPLWSLGTFDRSSVEFAEGQPKGPVVFEIGRGNPARDWFALHPLSGPGAAPRTIRFSLPATLALGYRLRVALMLERPSIPLLQIGLNGHLGRFYLHPKLDYQGGDLAGGSHAGYSHADLIIDLPPNFLQAGVNLLTLQPLRPSSEPTPEAGLNYDALSLESLDSPAAGPAVSAEIFPTVFYHNQGGQLSERVDVIVTRTGGAKGGGQVELEIGENRQEKPLVGDRDFGQESLQFLVPDFAGPAQAKVAVTAGGARTEVAQAVSPAKKWTVYVVPHIHVDLSYTDFEPKVASVQARVIDEALDLSEKHPGFNFSTDAEWNLELFMSTRSPADQARAIQALKEGRLFSPAQYLNELTGFPTAEALIRSLYPAANFSRLHGTPFDYSDITDVPSYSWSYASILASAGIDYLAAGSDNIRAPVLLNGRLNESSPFWWEGPDGQKVLLWYAFVYRQVQMLFGLPPLVAAGEQTLPIFLQSYDRPDYPAHATLLYGTQGENRDLHAPQAELAQRWNAKYAYPHLEYSGFKTAMAEIARQLGSSIQTVRGDGGPLWEDGIGGNAINAIIERETEARATSAEKLATLSAVANPRIAADKTALDDLWHNILMMDEHTGVPVVNVPEHDDQQTLDWWQVKRSFALNARMRANQIVRNSTGTLADSIAAPPRSLIVFNALNWTRSGSVPLDLKHGDLIVDPATGQAVPFRVVGTGLNFQRAEFEAKDVPAFGYKVYALRRPNGDDDAPAAPTAATGLAAAWESPYYRLAVDPASGAIRSLYDKTLGKELVDQASPYRFGQYLYVTGGDDTPSTTIQYGAKLPAPDYRIQGAGAGRFVGAERTPEGWSIRLESSAPNTPKIATEIRLFDRSKKVELVADLSKIEAYRRESVYFAFPFAMSHPQFQFEVQNGVVDPAHDMYPGAGEEWFSVQHWAAVQQDGVSGAVMPLDAGLMTLGDISRRLWLKDFGQRTGTIFSYVMNNYHQPVTLTDWHLPPKEDELRFRYVITSSGTTDPVELSRRGWEEITPLEVDEVQDQDKSWTRPALLGAKTDSFLTVNDPALLVETWKPAEDGNGTVLRLLDLGGAARTVDVETAHLTLIGVRQDDAVERDQRTLPLAGPHRFQVSVHPHEIVTLRLLGSSDLAPPRIP